MGASSNAPADVRFPIVILREAVLAGLRVERMVDLDRDQRFAVGQAPPEALDILLDARADEDERRRLDGVMMRFLRRDFSGASYGLALALADKRARYPGGEDRSIVATGAIKIGGGGVIAPIEGFDQKAEAVLDHLPETASEPLVFAFPAANLADASVEIRNRLQAAERAGQLRLRPAEHIGDLRDLWRSPEPAVEARVSNLWRRGLDGMAIGLVLIAVSGVWWHRWVEPVERCELAVSALEPDEARGKADLLRAAAVACTQVADARPGDGRAQFLAGQVMALDPAGEKLAETYWEKAAEQGDRDGLAAWGRHLWLIKGEIPTAIDKLGQAGKLGSAAALEDLAQIYAEGRGISVNLGKASILLARARKIREKS